MKIFYQNYLKNIIRVLSCILFYQHLLAQKPPAFPELKFEHIDAKQGFYPTSILANIVQDKTGFLWFGTTDGLYRFDGIEFRYFTHEPFEKTSLPRNEINCLHADDHNLIWIGTVGGLCFYNQEKETFSVFIPADKQFEFISHAEIVSFAPDQQNNLWVNADGKLVSLNLTTHEVKLIMDLPGLAFPFIDRAGNAWIGTDSKGLYRIDHATKKIKVYHHNPADKNSLNVDNIFRVTEDNSGNIWCATTEGVCRFDTATNIFKVFREDSKNPDALGANFAYGGVYVDHHGTVWAGTYGGGLNRFVPESGSFVKYKSDINNPGSIGCDNISSVFEDRSNVLWVATDGGGLYKCYPGKANYTVYQNIIKNKQPNISAIYCDSRGILWLAMYGEDTYSFDPSTKMFRSWLTHARDSALRYCMTPPTGYYDDGKDLYVTAVYEGLMRLNRETEIGTLIHSNYMFPEKVKDYTNYHTIDADSSGRLWIGSQRGIMIYDPAKNKLKSFKEIYKDTNRLSSDFSYIQFIEGYMWSLGSISGLTRINPRNGEVKVYRHQEGNPNSISWNSVNQAAVDHNHYFWIATAGGGLSVFDRNKETFRTFTMNDGLPSNAISGLLIDNCNNIWLISTKGVSRCSYHQDESPFTSKLIVKNFDFGENSGCNSNGTRFCTKGKDGTFYIASQSGLLAFHPDKLMDNPFVPPVVLTDLLLFNNRVAPDDSIGVLKSNINYTTKITLSYQQNVIGFKFAALSNNHPEKNRYAYMLEGFDKKWNYTDASKRYANYTNLNAGEYTFKVKASNNDGVWNENPAILKLSITPPYWETWWFRILVGIALISVIYSFYYYRLQQVIKLQVIRNNIASDLHDDIGSTLNSISVFSEVAKQQSEKNIPALEEIGKSSRKIIDAMSDIVWTINPENDNFEKIIIRMRSFAFNLLKAKKIEMIFKADPSLDQLTLPMLARKNFYLVFKEATNNIVKYSNASRASFHISHENKYVTMVIRDNGDGFEMEHTKMGNGIKNMKRRASEIGAKFKIKSGKGNGTQIELILKT